MKKITLFLLAVFALGLAGCGKNAQIDSFLTEWEKVTNEMVAKIDAGDVAGAKSVFDAKKESLRSGWDGVKTQPNEETKKKLEDGMRKNITNFRNSVQNGATKMSGDQEKAAQLMKLSLEYNNLFKM
jgi:hypothetical protein